jgi:hypothetical protein
LQRILLRVPIAAHTQFILHLPIHKGVSQLLNGNDVSAGALGSRRGRNAYTGLNLDALPRISRVIDVRNILAGNFHARSLRCQRARTKV